MNEKRQKGWGAVALWSALGLLVVLVIVMAVGRPAPEEMGSPGERALPVRVMRVEARRLQDTISLPARVVPFEEVEVAAEKNGQVVELAVERGARVAAGDLLARLDDRLWQTMRERARIEERDARREMERWEELKKTGAVAVSDYDQIRKRLDLATLALREAEVHVSQCAIRSPAAGRVEARYVDAGEFINEGVAAFKVADLDRVKLLVEVPERDVSGVSPGDALSFRVGSLPGRVFTGRVTFVTMVGSRESNSFRTELVAENPDRALRAGMIAEVSLVRAVREDAVVLPLAAVLPKRGEHVVFLVQEGRAVRRVVRRESLVGQEVVIASGVEPGDVVVVEGHRGLQDGLPLEVVDAPPASPSAP